MPISPEHVGRTYPATRPYVVTAVKIREFSAALGLDAGDGETLVAPPTFAALVINEAWDEMFDDPELDLSLSRMIHAEQRFDYHRPLRSGDVVGATLRIEKVRVRAGSEIISPVVAVTDADGQTVLEARATFFHAREGVS